ncbi:MAG: response regulator [Oscillospiraceae bacterium]|nr:response regulator [Oscillospiraceae bacterium]MCL2279396.1 response regulator [Oscillospiraceae bacterium]
MADNGTILLVESDPYINNANRSALMLNQYTVYAATSYNEARKLIPEVKPDIIVMEAVLPDGDGFDFCGEIRTLTTANIFFLTAKNDYGDSIRGLQSGGDVYIEKPLYMPELLARVDTTMQQRNKKSNFRRNITMNEEMTTQITESTATKSRKFKIAAQHWQGAAAMLLVCVVAFSAFTFLPDMELFGASYPFTPHYAPDGLIPSGWYAIMFETDDGQYFLYATGKDNKDKIRVSQRGEAVYNYPKGKFHFDHWGDGFYTIQAGTTYDSGIKNKFLTSGGTASQVQLDTSGNKPGETKKWTMSEAEAGVTRPTVSNPENIDVYIFHSAYGYYAYFYAAPIPQSHLQYLSAYIGLPMVRFVLVPTTAP